MVMASTTSRHPVPDPDRSLDLDDPDDSKAIKLRRRLTRLFRRASIATHANALPFGPELRRTSATARVEAPVPPPKDPQSAVVATPKPRRCVSMSTPTMQVIDTEVVLSDRKTFAAVSSQGARPYNEDRFRVVTHLERFAHGVLQCDPHHVASLDDVIRSRMLEKLADEDTDTAAVPTLDVPPLLALESATSTEFFGVFDGHGGDACSSFLSLLFPLYLLRASEYATDLAAAATSACQALNTDFQQRESETPTGAGSTALTLMIRDKVAYLCNIGDCRAILISESGVQALTTDHKAGEASERKRIEAAGGMVLFINGVPRVNGRLAVSRAFGDLDLAEHVIAQPDVIRRELTASDEFLILGSDGLWDALSNEDVLCCVRSYPWMTIDEITQLLVDRAIEHGSYDNVTCIVVDLRDPEVVAKNFL